MLMSHAYAPRLLRDPPPALSHRGYGEMVAKRVGERKGGGGVGGLLYCHVPRTFPKWTGMMLAWLLQACLIL